MLRGTRKSRVQVCVDEALAPVPNGTFQPTSMHRAGNRRAKSKMAAQSGQCFQHIGFLATESMPRLDPVYSILFMLLRFHEHEDDLGQRLCLWHRAETVLDKDLLPIQDSICLGNCLAPALVPVWLG